VCRDVPADVLEMFNARTRRTTDNDDEALLRLIERSLQEFVSDLELYVYSGARTHRARERSVAVVPPRIVVSASTAAVTSFDPLSLSVTLQGGEEIQISESSLQRNRDARNALVENDADLRHLRGVAERLRSACVNRGTIMRAITDAIFARSPSLSALLRSMESDHELFRMRAELTQRAFVDMANARLGIREQVSLF
jgi:hypothetical protein